MNVYGRFSRPKKADIDKLAVININHNHKTFVSVKKFLSSFPSYIQRLSAHFLVGTENIRYIANTKRKYTEKFMGTPKKSRLIIAIKKMSLWIMT